MSFGAHGMGLKKLGEFFLAQGGFGIHIGEETIPIWYKNIRKR